MDIKFSDIDLEELINTGYNKKYKNTTVNLEPYVQKVVPAAEGLGHYSFLHYEKLANNVYLSSVRPVNGRVERILFKEIDGGIEILIIELNDDHYGNKK